MMVNQQYGKPANQQYGKPANQKDQYTYRNLDVWNMAQEFAVSVIKLARRLPRDPASREIARQISRSAGSIGANIAEGHGRYTLGAYRNHLSIAKGSASEVDSWLDLLRRLEDITAEEEEPLHSQAVSLLRILTSKIKGLEDKEHASGKVREVALDYSPTSSTFVDAPLEEDDL
jgi:four helix bundle protein